MGEKMDEANQGLMSATGSDQEGFDLFRECLDAALGLEPLRAMHQTLDQLEGESRQLKEGSLPASRARALLRWHDFTSCVQEFQLRNSRMPPERLRDYVMGAVGKYAESHSLEDITSDESKRSDALKIFWKFQQWRRKEGI